jgi:molecular chaperone GrpE
MAFFLTLGVDETAGLAMSSAMQEPMKDEQALKNEEVSAEETVDSATAESSQPPLNTDEGTEVDLEKASEEEVDPWEQLELEVAKWKDQAIRTAAELENYRKRMSREKLDALRYGNQGLLEELLPVLDNFDMGMQAAAQEQGSMLYMGMDMVHKQIGEFLSSQGVTEIAAEVGGDFDPNLHEALAQEPSDEVEADKIIRVIRKGYKMGDRLLRPTNVLVSLGQGAEESAEEPQPESE